MGHLERIVPSQLVFVSCIPLGLPDQQIFDCVVQQELLAKVVQLLAHESIELFHHLSKDTNAMSADGIKHLIDADGLELLGLSRFLNEYLLMEIIMILANVLLGFTQKAHDVYSLFELLARQMTGHDFDAKLVVSNGPHVLISLEIVRRHSRHLIERRPQELFDLVAHVDLLFKQVQVVHSRVFREVCDQSLKWVDLVHVGYKYLVDAFSELSFSR